MSALKDKLTTLVEPLLASLGLRLWGLEFLPASRSLLRIYIENADGTDAGIDECSKASRLIGLTLDVEDIIDASYLLEVSTPGLERLFFSAAQLALYGGQVVELALHAPLPSHPGRKKFTGRVEVLDGQDKNFRLEPLNPADLSPEDSPVLDFDWEDLKKARLVYTAPEKKGAPKPKETRQKKK